LIKQIEEEESQTGSMWTQEKFEAELWNYIKQSSSAIVHLIGFAIIYDYQNDPPEERISPFEELCMNVQLSLSQADRVQDGELALRGRIDLYGYLIRLSDMSFTSIQALED
jgi:hypothetical protein